MKKIAAAFAVLCFFAAQNAQGNEIKPEETAEQQAAVADSTSAVQTKSEKVVTKATNEVELVADSKSTPQTESEDLESEVTDGEGSEFVAKYITGRLQIGTRMSTTILTDSDSGHEGGTYGSGTYLGTIYAIDEVQDYVPSLFFLKYFFSDYIAAELAYDSVSGETVATSIGYSGDKTDGEITLSGPTISLVGHIPNSTKFSPYASVGVGFYSGDFDEAAHWALGYKDPSQYEALGSPSTSYGGRTREIVIDSEVGILLGLGCTYAFNQNWLLDLSMQYTQVDVDATFNGYTNGVLDTVQDGHFPMDNVAFRLGLVYQF
ncbi:MAG: outer membrane protein W [Desulforhopalus sp.]|jgi:outer membrane protein W